MERRLWAPAIVGKVWRYRRWWEVWIALLIFSWVSGAFQAEVTLGFAAMLIVPPSVALLWRGAFGLETPGGLRITGSILAAFALIGGVSRVFLYGPGELTTWLSNLGFEVDSDIVDVFLLVLTASVAAGIVWFLVAHPSTMKRIANPAGRLAQIATDPSILRLARELTWLLGLISLALLPAAVKASWVPNVFASIVIPIAVLLVREDRHNWIGQNLETSLPKAVSSTPSNHQNATTGPQKRNRRNAVPRKGQSRGNPSEIVPTGPPGSDKPSHSEPEDQGQLALVVSTCGGCLLSLFLFGVAAIYAVGAYTGILYQLAGQGDAVHRFRSWAALLLVFAIIDAAIQVLLKTGKRNRAAYERMAAQ